MKKFGWVVVLVLALMLAPAVVSAQMAVRPNQGAEKETIGANFKVVPADQFNWDAVVGIQKSINLSYPAFVSSAVYEYPTYYDYLNGYLTGGNGGYAECYASIPFTKGAKKIVGIYFLINAESVGSVYVGFMRIPWTTGNPAYFSYFTNSITGWIVMYWEPLKAARPVINPLDSFVAEFYATNAAHLRACMVIYQ